MILFLMLACFEKDESDTAVDDTSTDDTATDDTGDTGQDNSCVLGEVFGTVLGINNTKEDVAIPLDCVLEDAEAKVSSVTLDGAETEWVVDGPMVYADAGVLTRPGVLEAVVTIDGVAHTTTFRAHTEALAFEQPEGLIDLGESWTGGLSVVSVSEAGMVLLSEDQLLFSDVSGKIEPPCDLTLEAGICLYGRCFASPGGQRFYGTDGTSVVSADVETCKESTWSSDSWNLVDIGQDSKGNLLGVDVNAKGDASLVTIESGDSFALGNFEGTLRMAEDTLLHARCKGALIFEDVDISNGKVLRSDETKLACAPEALSVQLMDANSDGVEDQLITLSYGETQTLLFRPGEGRGSFGASSEVLQASTLRLVGEGSVIYTDPSGATFRAGLKEDEASTIAMENPTFMGPVGGATNVLHSVRPPSGGSAAFLLDARFLVAPASTLTVAAKPSGEELVRYAAADGLSWELDGVRVGVLPDSPWAGIYDSMALSFTTEDLVIDEREMSTGADWDFRVVGNPEQSQAWAIALMDEGLEITQIDVGTVTQELLRKRKPLGTRGVRESAIKAQSLWAGSSDVPMASAQALSAFDDPLLYDSIILTMPWDTGTACPCATVLLPGVSTDPEEMLAQALVLATGEAKDCSDLPVPLGTVDTLGDGGAQVVLSDGSAYRINASQIPEKVVMEKEGDFYGLHSGDLNGDELGDVVLLGQDGPSLWLSAGDGQALETQAKPPAWVSSARVANTTPRTGSYSFMFWVKPLGL